MNKRGVKRFLQISAVFVAGTFLLFVPTSRGQVIPGEAKGFRTAGYDNANGKLKWLLSGASATNVSTEMLFIRQPRLELFNEDGRTNLVVATPLCFYNTRTKVVSSAEGLDAHSGDGGFSLAGEGFQYEPGDDRLAVSNRVHAVIRKDFLGAQPQTNALPATRTNLVPLAQTNVAAQLLHIYSDHLHYQTNLAVFEDNVRADDAQGKLTSGTLTLKFIGPERKIETISAEREVVIDSEELHATGDRANYQLTNDVVKLTGSPAWRLGEREGSAEELAFNRKTREFHAARSVKMTLPAGSLGTNGFLLVESPPSTNPVTVKKPPVQVSADDFDFRPDSANTNQNVAMFRGKVRVDAEKGKLGCELMTIKSSVPGNRTESVVAEQHVEMEQGESRVTGDKAVYTAASETVAVTGRPAWKMGQRAGSAETLTFDLKNKAYHASREVQMRLPAGSFGRTPWLLPNSAARTNLVTASAKSAGTTNAVVRLIDVSSDDFEFKSAPAGMQTDIATYSGHVRVVDPERMILSCEQLTGEMLSGTNQAQRVVAEKKVKLDVKQPDGEGRARGDKAVYLASREEVELTGGNGVEIVVVNKSGVSTGTGTKAVYAAAGDSFRLAGNPVLTTPGGQAWGDEVILDRAHTTVKATGNWKLKLNPEILRKAVKPPLKPTTPAGEKASDS